MGLSALDDSSRKTLPATSERIGEIPAEVFHRPGPSRVEAELASGTVAACDI
jgi:hypothetical protein